MAGMDEFSAQVQGQAMQQPAEMSVPLPLKIMGAIPMATVTQATAFNATRYANTMFSGGFLDVGTGSVNTKANRVRQFLGKRTGSYVNDTMFDPADKALGKTFLGKFSMKKVKSQGSNLTPTALRRFDSVSRLAGVYGKDAPYTPFQGASFVTNMLLKPKAGKAAATKLFGLTDADFAGAEGNPLVTGGVFGRLNTASRADDYQKMIKAASDLRGTAGFDASTATRSQRRVLARGDKATAAMTRLDENLFKVTKQTGFKGQVFRDITRDKLMRAAGPYGAAGVTDDMVTSALSSGFADDVIKARMGTMSVTEKLMHTLPGKISQQSFGYIRGMAFGEFANVSKVAPELTQRVAASFGQSMEAMRLGYNPLAGGGPLGTVDDMAHYMKTAYGATGYADDALKLLEAGDMKAIRSVTSRAATHALKNKQYGQALKMAGHHMGTYGKFAGKAFSAYGWATLAYDVGKGVGNAIMGGVNFSKEALKSMQGTINKPIFGAGYKDNEVAATSRARGVMAIQNSRLNARSLLGSEGAMMAAHFG